MFRKISLKDKSIYFEMVKEFYNSPAVLHTIPDSYIENTFNELMRCDEYLNCIIFQNDTEEVMGYALLVKTFTQEAGGNVIWLDEFYIREKYRSKGLGGEFLTYLNKNFPAKRYRLEVEPDNVKAKALYKRYGYQPLAYEQFVKES